MTMTNTREAARRHAAVKLVTAKSMLTDAYLAPGEPLTTDGIGDLLSLLPAHRRGAASAGERMNRKLAAAFIRVRAAELALAERLTESAKGATNPASKARLLLLAAFTRTHAARLQARLDVIGATALSLLPEPGEPGLLRDAQLARKLADLYGALSKESRAAADISSAWTCELNRAEKLELAEELEAA